MRISRKKHAELYKSIYDPIMDLRVSNEGGSIEDRRDMDDRLFKLENEIYRRIAATLNLPKS